jgi:hypothetical protein
MQTCEQSHVPVDHPETAVPQQSSSWKITMSRALALQQQPHLQTQLPDEQVVPFVLGLHESHRKGENQVKIEDESSVCPQLSVD